MLAELTCSELATALDAVAESLLGAAGVDGPPVDAFAVAARLGIVVAPDDLQAGRARFVRLRAWTGGGPKPVILLRTDERPEREHWAVAHEIGEHAAHRVFAHLGADVREAPAAREAVANWLAARLLLPTAWFEADGRAAGWDLATLKRRYPTASHELIARRMLDAPPPVVVSMFDHGRLGFRGGNAGGTIPPPTPIERRCQAEAHRTGQPCSEGAPACRADAWPIHEPGWRREIVRLELDEYCDAACGDPGLFAAA